MIKAIIFDLGGVVIDFSNKLYYERIAETSGKPAEEVKITIEKSALPLLEKGKITTRSFEKTVAKSLGIALKEVRWYGFYARAVRANSDILELLSVLHQDYRIAYLSNIDKARYSYTVKILNLNLFDYRFASCYIGARKPEPMVYTYALKKMGMGPSNALFIDNQMENVLGARKAGITSLQFKNRRTLDLDLAKLGL